MENLDRELSDLELEKVSGADSYEQSFKRLIRQMKDAGESYEFVLRKATFGVSPEEAAMKTQWVNEIFGK